MPPLGNIRFVLDARSLPAPKTLTVRVDSSLKGSVDAQQQVDLDALAVEALQRAAGGEDGVQVKTGACVRTRAQRRRYDGRRGGAGHAAANDSGDKDGPRGRESARQGPRPQDACVICIHGGAHHLPGPAAPPLPDGSIH